MILNLVAWDYGHGFGDSGAVNEELNLREDLLVREVGKEIEDLNKWYGKDYIVVSTDGSLTNRATRANKSKANLYVSLHFNAASTSSANGTEVLIHGTGGEAEKIAKKVSNKLSSTLGTTNRGVRVAKTYLGYDLAVLAKTTMPAILIEVSFISNKNDMAKYNPKIIAKAIFEAIYNIVESSVPNEEKKGWRVCIGYYEDINNAKRLEKEAKEKGFKDTYLVSYNK